jgi:hypothetical protein
LNLPCILYPINYGTYRECIFLWAVDPQDPLIPLGIGDETRHYVTLNIIRNKKILTKTRKSKAFYFEPSLEDKKKKEENKKKKNE